MSKADCETIKLNLKSVEDDFKQPKLLIIKDKDESEIKNCGEMKTEITSKEKNPLYHAVWLEPDPQDFELVADSVEGVRRLLNKFYVGDIKFIKKLRNSK
ncbi:hypothetical protein L9F63_024393, partial [Diploptera punctata]